MTDQASAIIVAVNDVTLCHGSALQQQCRANKLEGKPNSLEDYDDCGMVPARLHAERKSQHPGKIKSQYNSSNDELYPVDPLIHSDGKDRSDGHNGDDGFNKSFEANHQYAPNEMKTNINILQANTTCQIPEAINAHDKKGQDFLLVHSKIDFHKDEDRDSELDVTVKNHIGNVKDIIKTFPCEIKDTVDSLEPNNIESISTQQLTGVGVEGLTHNTNFNMNKPYIPIEFREDVSQRDFPRQTKDGEMKSKQLLLSNQNDGETKMLHGTKEATAFTQTSVHSGDSIRAARPKIKRRPSSTIRQIQERIRREQIKDMKGKYFKGDDDLLEECQSYSINNAPIPDARSAAAFKKARRKRSKSRTKCALMRYNNQQRQRPYRRWLGVSTCVTTDARFIVESPLNIQVQKHVSFEDNRLKKPFCKEASENTDNVSFCFPEFNETLSNKKDEWKEESETGVVQNLNRSINASWDGEDKMVNGEFQFEKQAPVNEVSSDNSIERATDQVNRSGPQSADASIMTDDMVNETVPSPNMSRRSKQRYREKRGMKSLKKSSPSKEVIFVHDDDCSIHNDGGLAGNTTSLARYEFKDQRIDVSLFESPPTDMACNKSSQGLNNKEENGKKSTHGNSIDPRVNKAKNKKSSLNTFWTKTLKKSTKKPEYINVQATKDCKGTLPGQLTFKKGQIVKQLDNGLNPEGGMCYGYYRTGRLRKKVWGIYPSSHVTMHIQSSSSEEDLAVDDSRKSRRKKRVSGGGSTEANVD